MLWYSLTRIRVKKKTNHKNKLPPNKKLLIKYL